MSSRSLGAFFSRGLTPTGGAFIFGQALVQGLNVQQCYTFVKFGIYWSMLVARMSLVILWPRLNGNLIFYVWLIAVGEAFLNVILFLSISSAHLGFNLLGQALGEASK